MSLEIDSDISTKKNGKCTLPEVVVLFGFFVLVFTNVYLAHQLFPLVDGSWVLFLLFIVNFGCAVGIGNKILQTFASK